MITITSDMQAFAIETKINRLISNRDNKEYVSKKLVTFAQLEKNWLPAKTEFWKSNIVMFYTVFSNRPFYVNSTLVNTSHQTYNFNCIAFVDSSSPTSIETFEYKKLLWIKGRRYTVDLDPKHFKFYKVVDVSIRRWDLDNYVSSNKSLMDEFNCVKRNLPFIKIPAGDLKPIFSKLHNLTADYREDDKMGKISSKNKGCLGWSLYKI